MEKKMKTFNQIQFLKYKKHNPFDLSIGKLCGHEDRFARVFKLITLES